MKSRILEETKSSADEQYTIKREGYHPREVVIPPAEPDWDHHVNDGLEMMSNMIAAFIMGMKMYIKKSVNYVKVGGVI